MSPFSIVVLIICILASLLLTGCQVKLPDGGALDWAALTNARRSSDTASEVESSMQTPEFTLLPQTDGVALSADMIFNQIGPAVAFVETPAGSGSGVLMDGGYLVSNSHVVWPYDRVRVVFPNGSEFVNAPVVAWDLVADLALIGPLEGDISPLAFTDGEGLPIGSTTYLIGYPGEVDDFPTPTITKGMLSRVRNWDAANLTFLQVDAKVTGGQSGGVLVSEAGQVIGISTFYFTEAGYGMVSSATDIVPRLTSLLADSQFAFNERRPLSGASSNKRTFMLEHDIDMHNFALRARAGDNVKLTVEGNGQPYLQMVSIVGEALVSPYDNVPTGQPNLVEIPRDGIYSVIVSQNSPNENSVELSSSHMLIDVQDPDDGVELVLGKKVWGNIDIMGEQDAYTFEMYAGERIVLEAESVLIDPLLTVLYESYALEELVVDDDSGRGIFGNNAQIVYEAPAAGWYTFAVGDASAYNVGAYQLSLHRATKDLRPSEVLYHRDYVASPFGRMAQFQSERHGFQIQLPAELQPILDPEICPADGVSCFSMGDAFNASVLEERLADFGVEDLNLNDYADLALQAIEEQAPGFKLVERKPYVTPQGLQTEIIHFTQQAGQQHVLRMIYLSEDKIGFWTSYVIATSLYEDMKESIDHSFATFRLWDEASKLDQPLYHLDEARRLATADDYHGTRDALARALQLDPKLTEAYSMRSALYGSRADYAKAIADLNTAITLDPENSKYYAERAYVHWLTGDHRRAVADSNTALALAPEDVTILNMRAYYHLSLNEFDAALADLERVRDLFGDADMPAYVRDTLAFAYLKMGRLEEAIAEYEALIEDDSQSPYVLLGAGIAHARLGNGASAEPLLLRGLADVEGMDQPGPTLTELIEWAEQLSK